MPPCLRPAHVCIPVALALLAGTACRPARPAPPAEPGATGPSIAPDAGDPSPDPSASAATSDPEPPGPTAIPAGSPPPEIGTMLAQIQPAQVRGYVEGLVAFGTRHTLSETESSTRGIGAARRWIRDRMQQAADRSGRTGEQAMTVTLDRHRYKEDGRRIDRDVDLVNVVAVLPGTMPEARDRHYYVIGHYDSRVEDVMDATSDAPGANDDASGTAVVMALAEVMARHQWDATLVFMATAAEEQGLLGARKHAEAARAKGVDIRAVLSNDIVGDPTDPLGEPKRGVVRVFSAGLPGSPDPESLGAIRRLSAANDSDSRQLARYVATVAAWERTAIRPMLVLRPDRFLRGGDHTAFSNLGIPAVRFCEVAENYDRQHQRVRTEGGRRYGDELEFVDMDYLADVARLNAATLGHLANAPSRPPRARIIVANLANDTTLRWDPSPEPDVAGYEILRRRTTAAQWQHVTDVGDRTEATVPFSKDNWFFAVRAYDRSGYRSPAAFPTAARD